MADRITGKTFASRSEVLARNAMVASSQPLATQAGVEILRSGGNAMDAAIAVNACLGLMEPTGCGIGGDLFAIVWDARSKRLFGLNGSGRSARAASIETMSKALHSEKKIPTLGPLSVSIPGCVDGWFALHGRFGRVSIKEVLSPAIHYAESGFPVSELIAEHWKSSMDLRHNEEGFLDTFTIDGNKVPAKGEIWRNRNLAKTLRQIADQGRDAFYTGEMAQLMAGFLERTGSFLRYEDFATHTSEWTDPVSVNYRGYDLWELPPSSQGIAALQILNILEGFELASSGFGSAEYLHAFLEAKKLAYADRARHYADPGFYDVPVEKLLSKEYADRLRSRIHPERAAQTILEDPATLRRGDTVYLCTADASGNMVSLIQSNFWGMGSGLCPPGLGFGFQNRGCSFSMDSGHANAYAPGKRPFHTIIPAFLTRDNQPLCAFGVMGGDMQPQGHAQIVCNLVDFGMNIQEAGDAPRIYHSGDASPTGERMKEGGKVSLESGFAKESRDSLLRRGHRLVSQTGVFGGYQAIWRDPETEVYSGASDSRKDGQAAGY